MIKITILLFSLQTQHYFRSWNFSMPDKQARWQILTPFKTFLVHKKSIITNREPALKLNLYTHPIHMLCASERQCWVPTYHLDSFY